MLNKTSKKQTRGLLAAGALLVSLATSQQAAAICTDEIYMGGVCMTAATFCPRGFMEANGQLLAISQYSALFSLYGTMYGGDGRSSFGLPDLRGRTPVGVGQGPGLSRIIEGQRAGAERVTLTALQMPVHSHTATTTVTVKARMTDAADAHDPNGNILSDPEAGFPGDRDIYSSLEPNTKMNAEAASATTTVDNQGGSQSLPIRNPYLGIRFCVATEGYFPPRS